MGLQKYGLLPNEFFLAHILCLETFDVGNVSGCVNYERWAESLGFRESKGLRPDKAEKVFASLVQLGIADVNAPKGTYELRPDATNWSRLRALRNADQTATTCELPLQNERPLSEALSDLSRERVLRGGPVTSWPALFGRLRKWIDSGARPQEIPDELKGLAGFAPARRPAGFAPDMATSAEKSADNRQNSPKVSAEKSAETQTADPPGFAVSAEKSAEKNQAKVSAEKSADASFGGVGGAAAAALAVLGSVQGQQQQPLPVEGAPKEPRGPGEAAAAAAAALQSSQGIAKAAAAAAASHKPTEAWTWVQSMDYKGQLRKEEIARQWAALCERDPKYVTVRLKTHLEKYPEVNDPLAWLSRKAREEGKLRR
jgi:hypothetical protein